jgi:hypothetical protein
MVTPLIPLPMSCGKTQRDFFEGFCSRMKIYLEWSENVKYHIPADIVDTY